MKHDSLADFEDKVTSTELYNVTIKKNHLCNIAWKAYLFPYV